MHRGGHVTRLRIRYGSRNNEAEHDRKPKVMVFATASMNRVDAVRGLEYS